MADVFSVFQVARITRILQVLQDRRELPQELTFLNRTPVVQATDAEIFMRLISFVQIADLVANDQKAGTYTSGQAKPYSTVLPNIKHGETILQDDLKQMLAVMANPGVQDKAMFDNWITGKLANLLTGVRQRWEQLIIAMNLDYGYNYNRLGIQMSNVSWGTPAELKVTTTTAWTDPVNATPVSDILNLKLFAATKYGKRFNRITMSTVAWRYLINTTDFQNKAKIFIPAGVSATALPLPNTSGYVANLANMIFFGEGTPGIIEFYDERYWQQNPDGTRTASLPFFPINQVLLSDTRYDNRADVMNLANGVATETVVSSLARSISMIGGAFNGPEFGPVGYATIPSDLNPPNLTLWSAAVSWPRKFDPAATAALKVAPDSGGGSMVDPVPVGVPVV